MTTVGPNDSIFEALELPHADEWLAKAELAREIERLIRGRDLTQTVGNAMNRRAGRGR